MRHNFGNLFFDIASVAFLLIRPRITPVFHKPTATLPWQPECRVPH